MSIPVASSAFRDLHAYDESALWFEGGEVRVPVTYRLQWEDGFGARGWKLDAATADEEIIASTRETGARIPTSVFVHDLLDHLLSGFALSGHWAEAMALVQLQRRTGTDIAPDYAQMAREDLMVGRLLGPGGPYHRFIGAGLAAGITDAAEVPDARSLAKLLRARLGDEAFERAIVQRLFALGEAGIAHARDSFAVLGLDDSARSRTGLCLQRALQDLDRRLEGRQIAFAHGVVWLSRTRCGMDMAAGAESFSFGDAIR